MKTSNAILTYLDEYGSGTVSQLSSALNLTRADIRYNLRILMASGLVMKSESCHSSGAGRPASRFSLQNSFPPELLGKLNPIFIDFMLELRPSEKQLEKLVERITESLFLETDIYGLSAPGLIHAIRHLDIFGFKITWEAGPKGPEIRILREPFTSLFKGSDLAAMLLDRLTKKLSAF